MRKRKLILRSYLSPGDIVLLTAAVRDLHRHYPNRFATDVRTSCPELWEQNPHITELSDNDPSVRPIDCECPLIDRSNEAPYHAIHGFAQFLSSRLGVDVRPTIFAGDIHLSAEERRWKSTVHELAGRDMPFWIVNAGGKFDFTIKWWDWRRYQKVVDYFRGKILFVQVGELGHYHPPLNGVIDLRGRTDLRQLVRLVYHAQGVLCGVTALMHLAAAVPTRPDRSPARAAVIVAGGREPAHWEAYPHHQFLHTIGALSCCANGGCWRARTRPLNDGEEADETHNLCSDVVGDLPHCMDMIGVREVVRRIENYFQAGANRFLDAAEISAAKGAIAKSLRGPRLDTTINLFSAPAAFDAAAREARKSLVPTMNGEGILLCAGNRAETEAALLSARKLRDSGSALSIECWMLVRCPVRLEREFKRLSVQLKVLSSVAAEARPATRAELRLHALVHSKLRRAIVLDSGVWLRLPPEKMFSVPSFVRSGAAFSAVRKSCGRAGIWKLCGLPVPALTADTTAFVIERHRCWNAIVLWHWVVQRNYFFNGYLDSEGSAAQLAFAKLGCELSLVRPLATEARKSASSAVI